MKAHKTYHAERIAEMVRIELAQMIEGEVRDPRVADLFGQLHDEVTAADSASGSAEMLTAG